ncbi:helix-turn-helix transcriptional regulator [Patescibacteria group bacterium]|nr:helix-turn-helix transcriptional regulator [Patescibacteria group bacterium]
MKVDSSKIRKDFGKHLRKIREGRKWTQEELAERAGMHFTYVGQIERGVRNPSLVNLYKLAKALKINAGKLFPF